MSNLKCVLRSLSIPSQALPMIDTFKVGIAQAASGCASSVFHPHNAMKMAPHKVNNCLLYVLRVQNTTSNAPDNYMLTCCGYVVVKQ